MKLKIWLMVAATGMMFQVAAVNASDGKTIVRVDDKDDFIAAATVVKKDMLPGGRFEFTTDKERLDIGTHLTDMQSLFDKFGSVAAMDENSKMQLYNDQKAVNATLSRRDGDRLVCESTAPTGSNIPRRSCRSYRQTVQDSRDAQQTMTRFTQTTQKSGH